MFCFTTSLKAQLSYDTLYNRAKEYLFANNYSGSLELYNACLKEALKSKDGLKIGNCYIGIGINYEKTGDYENALANYFKALPPYESINNIKKQGGTLKNIGNTYRTISSYDKALFFLQQAIIKYKIGNDSAGLSNATNDMGLLYMNQGKYDSAIASFIKVITTYKKNVREDVNAVALSNLGLVYSLKNSYDTSYNYYLSSLGFMKKNNDKHGIALVLSNLGDLCNRWGKNKEALEYTRQALEIAHNIQSKELIAAAYHNFAFSYADMQNYKESNRYLKLLIDMRDTIFKEESTKSYAEMESRYQNEKKQKEIILLKKDNDIKDLDITNQRRTRTFLLITLGFIVLIAMLIYRSYAAKKKLSFSLGILNEKLNEANQSKTKLLSIITHDLRTPVSNLFNFLQLQKSSTRRLTAEQHARYNRQINDSAENVLNTMEDLLIWSKSQMEKFEPVIEAINVNEFFDEIINLNKAGAEQKDILLIKECSDDLYLLTDPNFLKISVRNLVGNAIKFTPLNGTVHLIAERSAEATLITVKDNGEGIPQDQVAGIFNWNSIRSDSSGLGLRLAKEFAEKLNGSISVRSETGEGTSFTLRFSNIP